MKQRLTLAALALTVALLGATAESARASVAVAEFNTVAEGKALAVPLVWLDDGYSGRKVTIEVRRGSKIVRRRTVVAQPDWKTYRLVKNTRAGQLFTIYLYGGGWNGYSHRVKVVPG